MQITSKARLALLSTNLFFAINFSAIKYLTNVGLVKPFGLNLLRVGVCVIVLWLLFLLRPFSTPIRKKDIPRFILCALTGIAVNQMLFLKGLSMTYSIHASLLMLTTPILITCIAAWLLRERISYFNIAGLILGVAGATVLIMARGHGGQGNDIVLGDILIILNAISYAFYFILVRPLMHDYNPMVVIRAIFSIGLFMMLPFCWSEFIDIPWKQYAIMDFGILFLIVICGTVLAYLFNVYGIQVLGASIAGSYIYAQPLFAVIIAMIFMGEALTIHKVLAGILIFAGVYLSNKSQK